MSLREAIAEGRIESMAKPRGAVDATFPLQQGTWYRTFWNPSKGHLAVAGTDHSYCGLGLCTPEDIAWWIDSGWDEIGWFVIDTRVDNTRCRECSTKHAARPQRPAADPRLKAAVRQETQADAQRMDRIAKTVLSWFGDGAELVA